MASKFKFRAWARLRDLMVADGLPQRVANFVVDKFTTADGLAALNAFLAGKPSKEEIDATINEEVEAIKELVADGLRNDWIDYIYIHGTRLTHIRGFGRKTAAALVEWTKAPVLDPAITKMVEGLPKRRARWLDTLYDRLEAARSTVSRIERQIADLEARPPKEN